MGFVPSGSSLTFQSYDIVSTANITADTAALVAECGGSSSNQVDIMIGIGLVKDSEAVFFQYVGEDGNSQALVRDNGKPVTRIAPVMLTGIGVADGIGEFNATKLNIFVETQSGRTVMLTSGLQTIWSQCVITGLMGLADNGALSSLIAIDTWKGTSKDEALLCCYPQQRCQADKQRNLRDACRSSR